MWWRVCKHHSYAVHFGAQCDIEKSNRQYSTSFELDVLHICVYHLLSSAFFSIFFFGCFTFLVLFFSLVCVCLFVGFFLSLFGLSFVCILNSSWHKCLVSRTRNGNQSECALLKVWTLAEIAEPKLSYQIYYLTFKMKFIRNVRWTGARIQFARRLCSFWYTRNNSIGGKSNGLLKMIDVIVSMSEKFQAKPSQVMHTSLRRNDESKCINEPNTTNRKKETNNIVLCDVLCKHQPKGIQFIHRNQPVIEKSM